MLLNSESTNYLLGFEAAHHAKPSGYAHNPSAMRLTHRPRMHPVLLSFRQRRCPPRGRVSFMLPGMFGVGATYSVIVRQTSLYALWIGVAPEGREVKLGCAKVIEPRGAFSLFLLR